jgi:hypothetical protein
LSLMALALVLLAAPERSPQPVKVPAALAASTSPPELSGLAWSPSLQRYLVVSDDTGLAEEGTQHAPFVLALDVSGTLDEATVPITGIASLNDPEAICPGPAGSFFLATSHSPNRKGRTRPDRRQLLHLEERGRSLAVIGRLDLTALSGRGELLRIAGVDPEGRLDIEALAYHGGALYIGLKSPLTSSGSAVVLRLDNPVKALREGRARDGALTRWAELRLCAGAGAEKACQGLSDMVFLPDGSLVALANAPKGGPSDGGGAIWWAPAPASSQPPALLRQFPGLKPEGIALSSKKNSLMVVFDRDRREPLRVELPLPGATR